MIQKETNYVNTNFPEEEHNERNKPYINDDAHDWVNDPLYSQFKARKKAERYK